MLPMKSRTATPLVLLIISVNFIRAQKFQTESSGICETQGTCINCGDNRFSHYKCLAPHDCFADEICTVQGFCCPATALGKTDPSSSNNDFGCGAKNICQVITSIFHCYGLETVFSTEFVGVSPLKYDSEKTGICPDGSPRLRQCSADSDCIFGDEICAEGKCCSVCSQRRRQVLNDLPTNNVVGVHIPQCDSTGKYYRAVQCRTGTEDCWCVSSLGRIIGSLKPKTADLNAACEALRLVMRRIVEDKRKVHENAWKGGEMRRKQENWTSAKQEGQPVFTLSKVSEPKQQSRSIHNEMRNKCLWRKHGHCPEEPAPLNSISKLCYCDGDCSDSQKCCPVSTGEWACSSNITSIPGLLFSTTTQPPSSSVSTTTKVTCTENEKFVECLDQCQPSCFSRTSIPCIPEQCKGGCHCKTGFIRERNDPHASCIPENQCPQQIPESEKRCTDPLREYLSCGPSCPISCSSQNEKCKSEGCVEGCFCKIPYILENAADPIRSRCILPVYCLSLMGDYSPANGTIQITATPSIPSSHLFAEHYMMNQQAVIQCSDPLKNFQICGSDCPAGCNSQIAGFCGTQCVAGCFCRDPYILQDAYNLNSRCLRSCANPEATCTPDDCAPGCTCREPYLLYDSTNPNSRCVLPSECGSQCNDPLKEYQACASSCPLGCNNRLPQTCSPCVSGLNWRTSRCIPLNQCLVTNTSVLSAAFNPEDISPATVKDCPATTVDLNGKFCNFDSDCPTHQRCCRSTPFPMVNSKQSRCTCTDPHAYWDSCGTLCPEYCGQPAIPVCSSTCNPGCHCAIGYVKARNHVMAPCVLQTQCLQLAKSQNLPKDIATAKMFSDGNKIVGDVKIKEITAEKIRLEGVIKGLPNGEYALIVHQAGDLSNSCANIGPAMAPDDKFNVSAIFGNVSADGSKNATVDREVHWPRNISLIGHSLVIHKLSVVEWSLRNRDVLPLACGGETKYLGDTVSKSKTLSYNSQSTLGKIEVCLQYRDHIGLDVNCTDPKISSNSDLQTIANWILLLSNVAMCSLGVFTSILIGRLGDVKSRKVAMLIPFCGLALEGVLLVVQSYFMELSVYWLVVSEALFAAFGGYMSIFSAFFAYATDSVYIYPPKCRSLIIAILEGVIGLGGTVGYLCSFLLKLWGFVGLFTAFLVIYIICLLAVLFLPSVNNRTTGIEYKKDIFGLALVKSLWQQKKIGTFIAMVSAFALSFFTFIGSTHISFYYLKFRFGWDAGLYGFVKGPTQGLATLNVLFLYPFLRTHNFTDRTLSLIGVISRAMGRLWLAVAWSTPSTFLLVFFDSFTRFAASGMRAILASIVPLENHGSMFTMFSVMEAFSNLLATIIFHTLFPMSLTFLPQLSFYILAAVMLIPITILCSLPGQLTEFNCTDQGVNHNEFDSPATTITDSRPDPPSTFKGKDEA
uniref:Thyroglobulin type-1 domain-containing protein n=1 Tax=Setaria digitata TaxID=48799 RepID=A0A915PNA4_9BILA